MALTAFVIIALAAAPAYAAGSGMPWEAPLQQVVDSITGPVARAAAVIAIMFAATSFFLDFFGFAGGAVL